MRHQTTGIFPALLLVCILWLFPGTGDAACHDLCSNDCTVNPDGSGASSCYTTCRASCTADNDLLYGSPSAAPTAPHIRKYGAIALAPSTLEYGTSWNQPSQAAAEAVAMGYCRDSKSKPKDCSIQTWFYDACASLAVKPDPENKNGAWGAKWADGRRRATKEALKACQHYGGKACKTVTTFCAAQ